ncbi:MAG: hypothetical protein U5O39_08930 [Gammaproteobacteria bacterium]|nr:hypothetical protein [Gammaproteobacteria bacterium]
MSRLVETSLASQQEYDRAQALLEQAQAKVAVARADVAAADLDMDYATVEAPIAGHIGESRVDVGSLVTANQTGALAVVTALDPIYVDLSLPRAVGDRLRRTSQSVSAIGVSLVDELTGLTWPVGVRPLRITVSPSRLAP